jgi:NADP-dependent 3-hydroxy acid dehydrogenase YdfG
MTKTILITGASSGIGKTTAKYFLAQGWNVIATMRTPEKETELTNSHKCLITKLDVLDIKSIENAIQDGVNKFGTIDVFVNNAGFAVGGPFETSAREQVAKQFDVNVLGVFDCTKAILPHFRASNSGTIINVASVGGRTTFPYFSLYHSTKWALDGFSESLWYEMRSKNIKVKIIEPGAIKTDFYGRSQIFTIDFDKKDNITNAYKEEYSKVKEIFDKAGSTGGADPLIVAKTIFQAANDKNNKLRYTVGVDAKLYLFLRWLIPNRIYFTLINSLIPKKQSYDKFNLKTK